MSNGNAVIIHSTTGLIKTTFYKMTQYFPKPYNQFGRNIKVELDLPSYS